MNKTLLRGVLAMTMACGLSGCLVTTVVGAAVDLTVEVVKVPFKVGGAVVDAVSDDEEEEKQEKAEAAEKEKAQAEPAP
ncbi:MAG TPA: NF038104 family lipoprotein [Solimonas sp.]|nr:NF038104 family lipoprotein [Solimonas sp.]